jgi:hypothetical protein
MHLGVFHVDSLARYDQAERFVRNFINSKTMRKFLVKVKDQLAWSGNFCQELIVYKKHGGMGSAGQVVHCALVISIRLCVHLRGFSTVLAAIDGLPPRPMRMAQIAKRAPRIN